MKPVQLHWAWRVTIVIAVACLIACVVNVAGDRLDIWFIGHIATRPPSWIGLKIAECATTIVLTIPVVAIALAVDAALRSSAPRNDDGVPRCRRCGYIIVGLSQPTCPECGSKVDEV
jgi:hypothetical protein